MSHSKVTISQSMSKIMHNRLPEKRSPNILNKSNNISQSSKTSRVLDESFHNNSKLHNTSGLEIRHFLNLLNITDEDPKNLSSKPQSKSPVKNATSFVQLNTSPITKRASPTKKLLLNSAPDHHKNYANRSFISHAAESMNTIYEDKSITDPPSPTFYNPSHSILNKRSSMDGDRSYNNAKTSSQPNLCRSARNSILGGILGGLGETTPTKKSPMAGKSYTRPPSINTISGDIKKVSYSNAMDKDSRSKESSPFHNKNLVNNSMYSTQSISMIENIKSSSEKDKARQGNKSPLAINQKRSSTGSVSYQEGFNMKPVLEDVLDFPEKVKKMHNLIPKEKTKKVNVNGDNLNSGYTNYTNTSSYPQNAYNDLLNKKFGGIPQKANFFGTSKSNTEYKAKQSVRGSMNEISESTILDMILNSTTTTMHTEKKKYADTKVNSMQMIETRPLIKEVSLDVMNQIPKGILVNKSIERKPKTKPIAQENRPQEKPKVETALKNKPTTPERQVNISTAKANTKRPQEQKQLDRKESIFSVEHSEDSSVLQSPLQLACTDEHKSKSMMSLNLQRRSSSTKPAPNEGNIGPQGQKLTRGRSNAVAVLKRSSSMRRAKKEEEMDGKSVKTRKENKEFIELLNKISKNNQTEQIEAMFGKDEESLVKDLVEYIQAQNLSIGRARSNSYHKRMTILEKRIEEVRAKIPSLSALGLEEDKSDSWSDSKTVRSVENAYIPTPTHKEEEKTSFVPHRTKRSSFSLEAAKKMSTTTHGSSINDIQNLETGPMQHLLVPIINNQNQQDKIIFTPSLGPLSLQNIPLDKKDLIKLEDSARGADSQTENKTPKNKENSKANTPESEKREITEAAVELPVFGRTSTLHTQESTSSSLLTVAIETPPSKERESGTLPVLDGEETKQDNQLPTSNREPGLESPSLLFSVLSNGSNNKPAVPTTIVTPPPKEHNSPPRNNPDNTEENNNQLKPTLQRSEFANGSFGCLPQPTEPTRTTTQEPPKFGGLSSLTFKPPLPATHINVEDSAKPGMNISMVVHLKKKLKPVYIEKLDPEHLKATVYGEIHEKEHPGVSFGDLHDLFENAPLNKPAAAPAQPKKELKSLIMDGKRAQNMSILAMKFRKLPVNEFKDAIINLDPAILTSETCSTLLPFCPLPDEIKACQNNKEPLDKLDTASQFMLNIYDIPQLGARLRSTIFKNEFKERLDSVLDAINKVKTACDILKDNVHFKVFLRLSLEVANTLNEGTARGSALGLKPASLLSFDTVRSNKPGLTLLVYMAQKIFEQKPEILDFTADFTGIGDATKINIQDPIRSIQELKKDMNQLRLQLEISMDKNPPDTGFSNAFKAFYDSSAPLLVEAEEKYNKTNEHYVETAKFLGEDDESLKKKTSMEFFKVFKHLADTVEKFRSDEVEKRKREARRAAMKK